METEYPTKNLSCMNIAVALLLTALIGACALQRCPSHYRRVSANKCLLVVNVGGQQYTQEVACPTYCKLP